MIEYENDCVDCGLPCIGSICKYQNVPHIYCDECGDEGKIYHYDGKHLCINCIEEILEGVLPDDL